MLQSGAGFMAVAPRAQASTSLQILLEDGVAEAVVLGDELLDELVQTVLEDVVDLCVAEAAQRLARLALRRPLAAIGIAERIEEARDVLVAGCERARHAAVQHQEIGDEDRLHRL